MRALLPAFLILVSSWGGVAVRAAEITFDERVRAQEAIERVYYAHRSGTSKPFDQAITREMLEQRVRADLQLSLALEQVWNRPVTAADLQREIDRIARRTRYPERLDQVYAALDHDPVLVQECFARAALVRRIVPALYRTSPPPDTTGVASRDAWWGEVRKGLDPSLVRQVALDRALPQPLGRQAAGRGSGCANDIWDNGVLGYMSVPSIVDQVALWTGSRMLFVKPNGISIYDPAFEPTGDAWTEATTVGAGSEELIGYSVVWTGSEAIVWGGSTSGVFFDLFGSGTRYDPLADTWTPVSLVGAPEPRRYHSAVWTGYGMLVTHGEGGMIYTDGDEYDPVTDSWTPTTTNFTSGRWRHGAVWTDSLLIVWGGRTTPGLVTTGRKYDRALQHWSFTSDVGAPGPRLDPRTIWTGTEMIVWGGYDLSDNFVSTGGRYAPGTDQWSPMSTAGAPASGGPFVWTGNEMIVWSENDFSATSYDPAADTWTPISTAGAPAPSHVAGAVWTGSDVLVWGEGSGGRYDPVGGSWTVLGVPNAPTTTTGSLVWTGNELIVWDGIGADRSGRYDPLVDGWQPVSNVAAPGEDFGQTAIWSGTEMIVWGGGGGTPVDTGGRYDPWTDTWAPTSTVNAPSLVRHTAVWTGNEMIVWGGETDFKIGTDVGARYDPATDGWLTTTVVGAPRGRRFHTAVWTGAEMIIWGGRSAGGTYLQEGGRYDPGDDTWSAVTTEGAASARSEHTAVWSGDEMIVWGGVPPCCFQLDTGGRYNPGSDSWVPTTTVGAPDPRASHSATWTGAEMLVWGGVGSDIGVVYHRDGARYDPFADTWTAMSSDGSPLGRAAHAAVWTGEEQILWGGHGNEAGGRKDSGGIYFMGDADLDGLCNSVDNCSGIANAGQEDADFDTVGDVCDGCPATPDPAQSDADADGIGDPCDGCPDDAGNDADADGACGDVDVCPLDADDDLDGDGVCADADCQPGDPTDRLPAEAGPLVANRILPDSILLSWPAMATADDYAVVRDGLTFIDRYGWCVVQSNLSTTYEDATVPAPGQGLYYLVQPVNHDCGIGPLGFDSFGRTRRNTSSGSICAGIAVVDDYATTETSVLGTVQGDLADMSVADGVVQSVSEEVTSGNPSTRFSHLEHHWTFGVTGGRRVELHVEGFRTQSTDGDDFAFDSSTNGGVTWEAIPMATLPTAGDGVDLTGVVAGSPSGTILIRVVDTDRTPGNSTVDSVSLDELWIRSVP